MRQTIVQVSSSASFDVQLHIESSVGQRVLVNSTWSAVMCCIVELLDVNYMVHYIVSCRQIDKSGSSDHAPLVAILYVLSEVQQLAGA